MLRVCILLTHFRMFLRCIQWDKNIQTQARGQESYTSHYFRKGFSKVVRWLKPFKVYRAGHALEVFGIRQTGCVI